VGFEKVIFTELSWAGSKNTEALESFAEKSFPTKATKGSVMIEGDGLRMLVNCRSMEEMFEVVGKMPVMEISLSLLKELQCGVVEGAGKATGRVKIYHNTIA
jgi:hypothetical protein